MTDFYARLRELLKAARKEAFDLGCWNLTSEIDDLIEDVEFLEACRDSEIEPR